ncbi:zinc-ribbon domain-containing protein [Candidatus Pelagibacter sp.]|nr:zinc-ribbon domain-containing protein [Candidatus Pelagibacter sp.]
MIITCPSCNKKFNVDASLIPQEGRTLQCGFCDHKWFFKTENTDEEIKVLKKKISEPLIEDNKNLSENIKEEMKDEVDDNTESINSSEKKLSKKVNKKNDVNYFKILIVAFISFVALILVLDTFKAQLSVIIPNIQIILDNLYQSINDIKLFILDLVK